MNQYDAIVLGAGGVGSAALYHLARRGVRALAIERFEIAHDRGSSHGQTRLIRQAYFEHPDYVPLVQRAFDEWRALEAAADETLYEPVGLLEVGSPEGEVLRGVRESAQRYQLPIENLSARQAEQRFAGFHVPEDCEAVFESRAGYLLVEKCVRAQVALAKGLGAEVHTGESVVDWRADDSSVIVRTDRDEYRAARLIVAAGPWSGALLAELGLPLVVRRKPLYWFATKGDTYRADRGCPAFYFQLPHGDFYGVPQIDLAGIKVAEHTGGAIVSDPLHVAREVDKDDRRRVASFVTEYLPEATGESTDHTVCMYTSTPDGHFIIDRHPEQPRVVFAAGLSGHGFKFTCVLGQALAELALDGGTSLPVGFLGLARESLRPV